MNPYFIKLICLLLRCLGLTYLIGRIMPHSGAILMLHQVREDINSSFKPNANLAIEPKFFNELMNWISTSNYDVISIDEVPERLLRQDRGETFNPFLVITFDDGYLDNYQEAVPVLRAYNFPYTIYVATGLIEGTAPLWWAALEWVIGPNDVVEVDIGNGVETFSTKTLGQKNRLFEKLMHHCRYQLTEKEQRRFVENLCQHYDIDPFGRSQAQMMTMEKLRELSKDPLCTIGAHTVNHYGLKRLDEQHAHRELVAGVEVLAAVTGERPKHLAYPYGDPTTAGEREFQMAYELGFETAVTTRKGALYSAHNCHLMALPRISINGYFQTLSFARQWISGVPALLYNKGRKINLD